MSFIRAAFLGVLLLSGCGSAPQASDGDMKEVAAAAREMRPEGAPGETSVLDALETRARHVLEQLNHATDRAGLKASVPGLRRRLRESLGVDRLPKPVPRNVRPVGTIDRGSYVIEKLVYETFPGMEVPVHLYRPTAGAVRRPAILFVPGHWWADSKSRRNFQAFCINMARWGFVVLTYDPFGQGERGISWRDHRRTELVVAGVAQEAVVWFESTCALEYLLSRPEVDPHRIGITGASGGGYNSWIMGALEPRFAVSVPVVGTADFYEQLSVVRERDWYDAKEHCHFVPRLLQYANNHEFLAMVAPKPVLIISAHNDHSFRIPGIRDVIAYGRSLYGALDRPERIGYFEDRSAGHGYQKKKREAAYGWFRRWLQNEGDGYPVEEPATGTAAWDDPEMRCFPAGENRRAGPPINAQARALLSKLAPPSAPPSARKLEGLIVKALGLRLRTVRLMTGPKLERGVSREAGGYRVERIVWNQKDGVQIRGVLLAPVGAWKGALLAACDGGKERLLDHPAVRTALGSGHAVLLADPRGMGENAVTKPGWVFAVSQILGESFVGLQALDLVMGWRGLLALPELQGKPIGFLGSGPFAAMAATYAAVLEPRSAYLYVEKGFATYRSFVDRERSLRESYRLAKPGEERTVKIDREIPGALVVFDALRSFDVPDLLASVSPRPVFVANAIDGDWDPLADEDLARILRNGRYTWAAPAPHAAGPGADERGVSFFRERALTCAPPVSSRPELPNLSEPVERGLLPHRVHAVENYETDIEKRWWMAGRIETGNVPPGGGRACRGTLAINFDGRMGDQSRMYTAVIFNPVPGPPVGKNPRISFRYWIKGADWLRVQIYSLSRGFHRYLRLKGLPQGEWKTATVDMTASRRPDGSGGGLSGNERIDDIQFYTDPGAELIIDDIALYDAAPPEASEPFPKAMVFTGGFDTGRHGREWPGRFEIVGHEPPRAWKAARSTEEGDLRVSLRGARPLGTTTALRFQCRIDGADRLWAELAHRGHGVAGVHLDGLEPGKWRWVKVEFSSPGRYADEIRFRLPSGGRLTVDDLLLYVPAERR